MGESSAIEDGTREVAGLAIKKIARWGQRTIIKVIEKGDG